MPWQYAMPCHAKQCDRPAVWTNGSEAAELETVAGHVEGVVVKNQTSSRCKDKCFVLNQSLHPPEGANEDSIFVKLVIGEDSRVLQLLEEEVSVPGTIRGRLGVMVPDLT